MAKIYGKDSDNIDDIKLRPSIVWEKYEQRIDKAIVTIFKKHPWDREDLKQEAALFFFKFCNKFDPNHKGNNMNFADAFFYNLYRHLIGYIQKQHIKNNRYNKNEEITDIEIEHDIDMNINLLDEELMEIINKFPDKFKTILIDIINDIKQKETGEKLNIGQSRVSHLRKTILKMSQDPNSPAYELYKYLKEI